MEIILLMVMAGLFLGMAALNKQIAFIGLVGGVALIILGIAIATNGVQVQVGLNQTTVGSTEQIIFTYNELENVYPGSSTLVNTIFPILLGAAGVLTLLYSLGGSKI